MPTADGLTDAELCTVALAALRGSGRALSTEEIQRAVESVWQGHIAGALAQLVLDGELEMTVPEDGGEVCYGSLADGPKVAH